MQNKITLITLMCAGLFAGEANAQNARLLATANSDNAGKLTDSVKYFHSGTRGTTGPKYAEIPEYKYMEDSAYYYTQGTTLARRTITTYNSSDDITQQTIETNTGGTWKTIQRVDFVFKNNKPDSALYYTTFGSGSNLSLRSTIVYTWSGNDVATALRVTRSGGGNPKWSNDWRKTYAWAGGMMTDSTYEEWSNKWDKVTRKKYIYTAGTLTQVNEDGTESGNWKPFYQATYKYDASVRVIEIDNRRNDNNGGWANHVRDTFWYNPGNTTKTPDSTIRIDASTGGFVNQYKLGYEYTTAGLITKRTSFRWNGSTKFEFSVQDSVNRWHYGAGSSVETINQGKNVLSIYPSPASNTLHIKLAETGNKEVQYVIIDMQGRAVKSWNESAKAVTSVSISELPAGNYVLNMTDGTRQASQKFVVAK